MPSAKTPPDATPAATHADALREYLGPAETRSDEARSLIALLPLQEQVCLKFHVDGYLTQTQVAELMGVSQPTVTYCLERARERLEFLKELRTHTREQIILATKPHFSEEDVQILVGMFETVSQSETGRRVGISQGKVRYRVGRSIRVLEAMGSPYARLFRGTLENLNVYGIQRQDRDVQRFKQLLQDPLPLEMQERLDKLKMKWTIQSLSPEETNPLADLAVEEAKALIGKIRGGGPKTPWTDHPAEVAELVRIFQRSGLTANAFGMRTGMGQTMHWFLQGRTSYGTPWPALKRKLEGSVAAEPPRRAYVPNMAPLDAQTISHLRLLLARIPRRENGWVLWGRDLEATAAFVQAVREKRLSPAAVASELQISSFGLSHLVHGRSSSGVACPELMERLGISPPVDAAKDDEQVRKDLKARFEEQRLECETFMRNHNCTPFQKKAMLAYLDAKRVSTEASKASIVWSQRDLYGSMVKTLVESWRESGLPYNDFFQSMPCFRVAPKLEPFYPELFEQPKPKTPPKTPPRTTTPTPSSAPSGEVSITSIGLSFRGTPEECGEIVKLFRPGKKD